MKLKRIGLRLAQSGSISNALPAVFPSLSTPDRRLLTSRGVMIGPFVRFARHTELRYGE